MLDGKKVLGIVHKNVNVPGLASDMLKEVLDPALQKVVDDTTNPFDNIAKAAVMPLIQKAVDEALAKYWETLKA